MSIHAAQDVMNAIEELGARGSNAVLEVLSEEDVIRQWQKYPSDRRLFEGTAWRGYYHSHPAPQRPSTEHGHFHLFAELDHGTWSHVVALSVDHWGQPLCWFAVNRWVTGEAWIPAAKMMRCLPEWPVGTTPSERWLAALLRLYEDELSALLDARDAYLTNVKPGQGADAKLEDRNIYCLSEIPIWLSDKLQSDLLGPGAPG